MILDQAESVGPGCDRLVAGDVALDPADEEIEAAVAVEIDDRRDVLAIEEHRRAVGVAHDLGGRELRGGLRAGVAVQPDVAERLLGEEVDVAVGVDVDEAVPLTGFEALVLAGAPLVARRGERAGVLEEPDRVLVFLHEQVEVAVGVDVDELRPRHVETAEERQRVLVAGRVDDLEGGDGAVERGRGLTPV